VPLVETIEQQIIQQKAIGSPDEVPILKQGGKYLIASIQSALTDADLLQLRDVLVEHVGRYRSRGR